MSGKSFVIYDTRLGGLVGVKETNEGMKEEKTEIYVGPFKRFFR